MRARIITKAEVSPQKQTRIFFAAVVLALLTTGLFLLFLSFNPLDVYLSLVNGAFGSIYRFKQTIITAIPLVVTSLGISIAFKMKFWNIGAEGQIIMGAFCASFVALNYPGLPRPLLLGCMFLAAFAGGAAWGVVPAFFKAKWSTNETIFTLMMNYVALKWIVYLQYGPWKDPKAMGFPTIPNFVPTAQLPKFLGLHIGWIIAVLLVVIVYVFLNHSKKGFEIAVLGESSNTARYAGINVFSTIILAMALSGGICGIVGMIQTSGVNLTLSKEITGGVGYTAIITAWLGRLKPHWIVLVSLLFAALVQGSSYIQSAFGISAASAQVLQAIILFFVLGSEFFTRYSLVLVPKELPAVKGGKVS